MLLAERGMQGRDINNTHKHRTLELGSGSQESGFSMRRNHRQMSRENGSERSQNRASRRSDASAAQRGTERDFTPVLIFQPSQ